MDHVGNMEVGRMTTMEVLPGDHRKGQVAVADLAESHITPAGLSAIVTTSTDRVIGGGPAKISIVSTEESFRAREAILFGDQEVVVAGATWSRVRANMTLQYAVKTYGERLLAFDSTRREVTAHALGIDVFSSSQRSVRVLVRDH